MASVFLLLQKRDKHLISIADTGHPICNFLVIWSKRRTVIERSDYRTTFNRETVFIRVCHESENARNMLKKELVWLKFFKRISICLFVFYFPLHKWYLCTWYCHRCSHRNWLHVQTTNLVNHFHCPLVLTNRNVVAHLKSQTYRKLNKKEINVYDYYIIKHEKKAHGSLNTRISCVRVRGTKDITGQAEKRSSWTWRRRQQQEEIHEAKKNKWLNNILYAFGRANTRRRCTKTEKRRTLGSCLCINKEFQPICTQCTLHVDHRPLDCTHHNRVLCASTKRTLTLICINRSISIWLYVMLPYNLV